MPADQAQDLAVDPKGREAKSKDTDGRIQFEARSGEERAPEGYVHVQGRKVARSPATVEKIRQVVYGTDRGRAMLQGGG